MPDDHQVAARLDLVTSASVLAWTAFEFEGDGRVVTGERTPAGVSVDGRAVTVYGDDCHRVELRVDGVRTNTYWIKDGVIVVSDWGGARSFAGVATEVQSECAERS